MNFENVEKSFTDSPSGENNDVIGKVFDGIRREIESMEGNDHLSGEQKESILQEYIQQKYGAKNVAWEVQRVDGAKCECYNIIKNGERMGELSSPCLVKTSHPRYEACKSLLINQIHNLMLAHNIPVKNATVDITQVIEKHQSSNFSDCFTDRNVFSRIHNDVTNGRLNIPQTLSLSSEMLKFINNNKIYFVKAGTRSTDMVNYTFDNITNIRAGTQKYGGRDEKVFSVTLDETYKGKKTKKEIVVHFPDTY